MSKLKYYFDLMSQPSRALWISLKMSNTAFEECPVALRKMEQLTDDYKQINRFQKVPCIVDGEFKLSESVAIVRYLADRNQLKDQLYPKALRERARVDEFLEWHHLALRYGCANYFMELWLLPMRGQAQKPSTDREAQLLKQMEIHLRQFEEYFLKDSKYISSDKLTVADLFATAEIEQTKLLKYDINASFPRIGDWMQKVRSDASPFYDEAHKFIFKKSGLNVQ